MLKINRSIVFLIILLLTFKRAVDTIDLWTNKEFWWLKTIFF